MLPLASVEIITRWGIAAGRSRLRSVFPLQVPAKVGVEVKVGEGGGGGSIPNSSSNTFWELLSTLVWF